LILLVLLIACGEEKVKPDVIDLTEEKIPTQESWNDTIYFSQSGKLQATLTTTHLKVYEDERLKLLDSVKVEFYDKNGKVNSTLKANKGRINDTKNEFTAFGNVRLAGSEGRKLFTEKLTWNPKTEKIYSDTKVKIFDGDEIIEGAGFVSDKDLTNYVIRKIFVIKSNLNKH